MHKTKKNGEYDCTQNHTQFAVPKKFSELAHKITSLYYLCPKGC
jgi:hypothetical protein